MDKAVELALKQYEAQKKRSNDYYNKKKQQRLEDGSYRGRGRPRKVEEPKGEGVSSAVNKV